MQIRRLVVAAVAALGLTVLGAGPAWAHASFDLGVLPASDTADVVLRVPIERDSTNAFIDVLVPEGWTVASCGGAAGWSCATSLRDDGNTVVNLAAAETGAGETERFSLALTTPAAGGTYSFPVVQVYADGTEAAWIGDPGEDRPAPQIQVGDDSTPVAPSSDPPDHDTDVDSDTGAEATQADSEEESDVEEEAVTADDGSSDAEGLPDDFTPADGARAVPAEESESGSALPWVLGAFGVIALAVGTAVVARR